MAEIKAALVKDLRDKTGAGMMVIGSQNASTAFSRMPMGILRRL